MYQLKKKMPRVNLSDVSLFGEEIKFKLMLKKIEINDIDNFLFPEAIQKKQTISISELKGVL